MSNTTADNGRSLAGQSAVVTGASRGIGLAIARALCGAGARVVLVARSRDALQAAAVALGPTASWVTCDLANRASIDRALDGIRTQLGRAPDVLVNNAGIFLAAGFRDTSTEDFEQVVRVNVTSQFELGRAFVGEMRERGSGHLVTIGSTADRSTYPENAAYAASKFAVRGLHESLREELRGSGVRVTLVSPGPVDTTLWDDVNPDSRPGFSPRARMLDAAAVADVVRYVVACPPDVNVDELRLTRA